MALKGRLGPHGIAIPNVGSFAGKVESIAQRELLSRMGAHALGIPRVGNFAGKAESTGEEDAGARYRGMLANTNRMMTH